MSQWRRPIPDMRSTTEDPLRPYVYTYSRQVWEPRRPSNPFCSYESFTSRWTSSSLSKYRHRDILDWELPQGSPSDSQNLLTRSRVSYNSWWNSGPRSPVTDRPTCPRVTVTRDIRSVSLRIRLPFSFSTLPVSTKSLETSSFHLSYTHSSGRGAQNQSGRTDRSRRCRVTGRMLLVPKTVYGDTTHTVSCVGTLTRGVSDPRWTQRTR